MEEKLNSLAYYQNLTGLPNGEKLKVDAEEIAGDEEQYPFSIILLDVDNFKDINDALSYEAGDIFLQYIGISLQKVVRSPHQVYHFGGDKFALILKNMVDQLEIDELISQVNESIGNVWNASSFDFYITSSIGISHFPASSEDVSELLRLAEIAMFKAKSEGKNRHIYYTDSIHTANVERINLINQLQKAIEKEEFILFYQPQLRLVDEQIVGVEALVRWQHPERGILSPFDFIPLAEETGLIYDLEELVFGQALLQHKKWCGQSRNPLCVSINLSGKTLNSEEHFSRIKKLLAEHDFKPGKVTIEITETAVIEDSEQVVARLKELKNMGISIALDDFGTGYSSITHLIDMPIDTIKIDRSFIQKLNINQKQTTIVDMILKIAEAFDYQVVAEGIEELSQKDYLRQHKGALGQGFLFDKALAADEIESKYL